MQAGHKSPSILSQSKRTSLNRRPPRLVLPPLHHFLLFFFVFFKRERSGCRLAPVFAMHERAEQKHSFNHSYSGISLPLSNKTCVCLPLPPRRATLTRRSVSPSQLLHDSLEYLEENSDNPLKRKSPYILKRQATHTAKSRRPYILKRSTIYWQPSRRPRWCLRGPHRALSVNMWLCFFLSSCSCGVFSFPVVVFNQSDPSIVCPALRPACILLLKCRSWK